MKKYFWNTDFKAERNCKKQEKRLNMRNAVTDPFKSENTISAADAECHTQRANAGAEIRASIVHPFRLSFIFIKIFLMLNIYFETKKCLFFLREEYFPPLSSWNHRALAEDWSMGWGGRDALRTCRRPFVQRLFHETDCGPGGRGTEASEE